MKQFWPYLLRQCLPSLVDGIRSLSRGCGIQQLRTVARPPKKPRQSAVASRLAILSFKPVSRSPSRGGRGMFTTDAETQIKHTLLTLAREHKERGCSADCNISLFWIVQ